MSRAETLKNPNPVLISGQRSWQSSDQVHDFLLCWDCEQLLSREGENWVLPQLADEAGFPLLASLHSALGMTIDDDLKIYRCAEIDGIDCEKLAHFAMGMFWKGHVHEWRNCERLHLGSYGESIRKFLRSEGPFPENVALLDRLLSR